MIADLPDTTDFYTDGRGNIRQYPGTLVYSTGNCAPTWEDVALEIVSRTPCPVTKIHASNMSDEVPGFLLARSDLTAIDYLRALCGPYFVSLPEYDGGIHAIRMGGAVVRTLTDDDFYETEDEDDDTRGQQQVEAPLRVTLFYPDPANNYVVTPQTATRSSPDFEGTAERNVQTTIPFTAEQAAQIADKMQKVAFSKTEGKIKRALPTEFMDFVSSDCFLYGGRRYMIDRARYEDLMVSIEASYDRASDYGSVATGIEAPTPTPPPSSIKGPSVLKVLQLPTLRAGEAVPGVYLAVQGLLDGWPGADIYLSVDGGVTEQLVMTITDAAVIGELSADTDEDGNDSSGLISVELLYGGALTEASDDQLAARLNGFALESEIGQFKTPTETDSTGLAYDLTEVSRGQWGTTAASHLAGAPWVLLDGAVKFLAIDTEHAGKTLIARAVTIGTPPASNTGQALVSFVFDPPTFIRDGGVVTP